MANMIFEKIFFSVGRFNMGVGASPKSSPKERTLTALFVDC